MVLTGLTDEVHICWVVVSKRKILWGRDCHQHSSSSTSASFSSFCIRYQDGISLGISVYDFLWNFLLQTNRFMYSWYDAQRMCLCVEHPLIQWDHRRWWKQKVQIFQSFCKKITLHPVVLASCGDLHTNSQGQLPYNQYSKGPVMVWSVLSCMITLRKSVELSPFWALSDVNSHQKKGLNCI